MRLTFLLNARRFKGASIRSSHVMSATIDNEVLVGNLRYIQDSVQEVVSKSEKTSRCLLVAVSKTKSAELIKTCYETGQEHFGENYVQELEEKSKLLEDLENIKWHFIGQVQSNKIGKISACKGLYAVQTLQSVKHCLLFNKEMEKRNKKLNVFVQVNTSAEAQKGGVSTAEAFAIADFIRNQCSFLNFIGFMTIGSVESSSLEQNPDFDVLYGIRQEYSKKINVPEDELELSMGMSTDYEAAILQGSTCVRVGSRIFGPRIYK